MPKFANMNTPKCSKYLVRSHLNTPKTYPMYNLRRCIGTLETVRSSKVEQYFKLKHATVQQKAPENNQPRLFLSHQEKNCPNLFRTKLPYATDLETHYEAITIIQSDIIQQVIWSYLQCDSQNWNDTHSWWHRKVGSCHGSSRWQPPKQRGKETLPAEAIWTGHRPV